VDLLDTWRPTGATRHRIDGELATWPRWSLDVLRLGPHSNGMSLSPWEFGLRLSSTQDWRYESVNGVLIVNPPPSLEERDPNEELGPVAPELPGIASAKAIRWIQPSRNRRSTSDPIGRRVDRAIWAGLRRLPQQDETPTIAVEFVSEGRRSRQRDTRSNGTNIRAAELGVPRVLGSSTGSSAADGYRFARARKDERRKPLPNIRPTTTPLLPGFELPLASLLALMDRWSG